MDKTKLLYALLALTAIEAIVIFSLAKRQERPTQEQFSQRATPVQPVQPVQPKVEPERPSRDVLEGFPAYPQQAGTSCGPCAVKNSLMYLTGTLHSESKLHQETIEADQEGLKHLEKDLRRLGIRNPRLLSSRGTTPIGNTAVLNKYLPRDLKAEYKEITSFEERKKLIIESINNNRPVIVPLVSGGFQHWTVCIGYDLEQNTFLCVNAGLGSSSSRTQGGTYNTISAQDFDDANSFKNMPGGIMGKVYELANENGIGKCVLIYLKKVNS
jgi:hypothetical protein